MLRVLVGCETSGVTRNAFQRLGHYAISCDLLPSDDDSDQHIIGDVFDVIDLFKFDIIILHPPCTALCVSGNAHYGNGMPKSQQRTDAMNWTKSLWDEATSKCKHVALENPVGVLNKVLPVKAKYVQPYEFGHPESKKTGFWLKGLPPLRPTNVLQKPECGHWDNQTPSGQNKLAPSADRWKIRSKTYEGLGGAMSSQWSKHVESLKLQGE
jgi:hypothetical protein